MAGEHAEDNDYLALIRLVDFENRFIVQARGREEPGVLTAHDTLRLRVVAEAPSFMTASVDLFALPGELESWGQRLQLARTQSRVVWSELSREPDLVFESSDGVITARLVDTAASGVEIRVPVVVPWSEWIDEQLELLSAVRSRYPRQVVETSPGAYQWVAGEPPAT